MSAGSLHTCALTDAGDIKCWGHNASGQLGDRGLFSRTLPTSVSALSGTVTAISAGEYHTCAITEGGAKCWGSNEVGQLGDGNTVRQQLIAVDVFGLGDGVSAISAGDAHTCAVTRGGGVSCWGLNAEGQLGDGSDGFRLTPVDVSGLTSGVAAVSTGALHACVVTGAGEVKCWGYNLHGELGDGTTTNHSTPVTAAALGNGVTAVTSGRDYTCALYGSGAVKCVGVNDKGQLGSGSSALLHLAPVSVTGLGSDVVSISAGDSHTCALTGAGGVKCWGRNWLGQLGDGTTSDRLTPVDVSGLSSGVAAITAGGSHTCALTDTGEAKCWGANGYGELGDGTWDARLTPVRVSGLGSGVIAISAGLVHTCALSAEGGVTCWGDNSYGQLGDGSRTTRLTAVEVSGLSSGISAISAGGLHSCAISGEGEAKCWGTNSTVALGDGSTIDRLTPVSVSGLGSGASSISAGRSHTCALTEAGSVKCWGNDLIGQVGDGGRNYALPGSVVADESSRRIEWTSAGGRAVSSRPVSDALGRYVLFESRANTLVPDDRNNTTDIFRRDTVSGVVERVSVYHDGSEITGQSIEPSVSAEGQLIVFVAPDSGASTHGVFLRNLMTGSTRRVGTALRSGTGTRPVISPQGNRIAFTGLPTVQGQGAPDVSTIFIVDLQRFGDELLPSQPFCPLCVPPATVLGQSKSSNPVLSADGKWLAFESEARSVPGQPASCPQTSKQILLHNLQDGSTVSASTPSDPSQCRDGGAMNPSIDWSGSSVVFETDLPLDANDRNGLSDIYRFDALSGQHERISTDPSTGHDGLASSSQPRISGDGKVVTFQSLAKNIESSRPDNNETSDIFVRTVENSVMRRVSRNRRGDQGDRESDSAALSWDGGTVVFASKAGNLIVDPQSGSFITPNGLGDVYRADNPLVPIRNTGTWWVPAESGWGLSTIDQGSALGVSWFTYDDDGEPTWFSGSALLQPDGRYVGSVFRQMGVPLADITGIATESSVPFEDITLSFNGSGALTFDYAVIGGPTQRKQMSRFIFDGDDIVCRSSPFNPRDNVANLSDVWWGGAATSGWGILLSETTAIMAATWYTYDLDREAVFLIAITTRQADGSYTGSIFRQRNGTPYDEIDNAPPSAGSDPIGTARFTIIDGETVDFDYTIGAVSQTKRISRFVFGATPNVCTTTRP